MDEGRIALTRIISQMPPGPELDKFVALVLFDIKCEPCDMVPGTYHLAGSLHYPSKLARESLCTSPLPAFSTEWAHMKTVVEWMASRFPGFEFVMDCDRWSCNVNNRDARNRWFRITHAGAGAMQEAICKAALLSMVNPQNLPLEIRARVVSEPVVRGRRAPRKRRKKK